MSKESMKALLDQRKKDTKAKIEQVLALCREIGIHPNKVADYIWLQDMKAAAKEEADLESTEPSSLQDQLEQEEDLLLDDSRSFINWCIESCGDVLGEIGEENVDMPSGDENEFVKQVQK